MPLLPPNATDLERALEEVITEMLEDVPVPIRALRVVADCPEEWLPYLAWERGIDAWDDAWPAALKRAVVAEAYAIHVEKGTVAADRRILDGAGAVYGYSEGAGADHHTVRIAVRNSGSLLVTVGDLERAIDHVRRASVHYTLTAEAGFCALPVLVGGMGAVAVARFEGAL